MNLELSKKSPSSIMVDFHAFRSLNYCAIDVCILTLCMTERRVKSWSVYVSNYLFGADCIIASALRIASKSKS